MNLKWQKQHRLASEFLLFGFQTAKNWLKSVRRPVQILAFHCTYLTKKWKMRWTFSWKCIFFLSFIFSIPRLELICRHKMCSENAFPHFLVFHPSPLPTLNTSTSQPSPPPLLRQIWSNNSLPFHWFSSSENMVYLKGAYQKIRFLITL